MKNECGETCKYNDLSITKEPCRSCCMTNWEPVRRKHCDTCEYTRHLLDKEPCLSCGHSNWEPK
jgi:hypothetical protein